jgi:hypothetical protein
MPPSEPPVTFTLALARNRQALCQQVQAATLAVSPYTTETQSHDGSGTMIGIDSAGGVHGLAVASMHFSIFRLPKLVPTS